MYRAKTSGSTTGKSGKRWQWNAGEIVKDVTGRKPEEGELDHVASLEWEEGTPVLPEDLPGRSAFLEAGIETVDQIRALDDPTEITGVGDATARQLAEWFAAQ